MMLSQSMPISQTPMSETHRYLPPPPDMCSKATRQATEHQVIRRCSFSQHILPFLPFPFKPKKEQGTVEMTSMKAKQCSTYEI